MSRYTPNQGPRISDTVREVFESYPGLFQDAAKCSSGQFAVQWHRASGCAFYGILAQNDVASLLANLMKSKLLEDTYGLVSGDLWKLRH